VKFCHNCEAHLFAVRLVATEQVLHQLKQTLSADEVQRVERFRFEKHQEAFVIARGLLRVILASYLGISPKRLIFRYEPNGKPRLHPELKSDIHFNLAHSENCAVYALSRHCELGVDVEFSRAMSDAASIAERFFAENEYADFLNIDRNKQNEAFYACWTRKEAYLKLTGQGMSMSPKTIRASLAPGQPPTFLSLGDYEFDPSELKLFHLAPFEGYVGALAIRSKRCILQQWHFEDTSECLAFLDSGRR
jgi:4'-phosphopantetheinyl transferase